MGLDFLEIEMELEDRFRIKLPDADISNVRTVADLAALVCAQLERQTPRRGPCQSSRIFYSFRRALRERASVERSRVRPNASLVELLPGRRARRRVWRRLRDEVPRLPPLVMSRARARAAHELLWLVVLTGLGIAAVAFNEGSIALSVATGIAVLACGFWIVATIKGPWEAEFPAGITTVGDLVRASAPLDLSGDGSRLLAQTRVLEEVRRITADQLGMKMEEVRPESEFVRDLEID